MAEDLLFVPGPRVDDEGIRRLLADVWSIEAHEVVRAASERDLTLMVDGGHVLKIAHPGESPQDIAFELDVLGHVTEVDPMLPVPRVVATGDGGSSHVLIDGMGRECVARVLSRVPGVPVEGRPVDPDLAAEIGGVAARTSLALQGLHHERSGRRVDWDVRRVGEFAERSGDPRLVALADSVQPSLQRLRALPAALQHADVTLTNVLTVGGRVSGLIDLGDMHHTAAVCDLAATLTSVLRNTSDSRSFSDTELVEAVLRGYQHHRPLLPAEVDVLSDLVVARLVLTLAISRLRAPHHRDNVGYIAQYDSSSAALLDRLVAVGRDDLTTRWHRLAGTAGAVLGTVEDQDLRHRRDRSMGGGLMPLFYDKPLQVVGGRDVWLHTADGRRLLDAYNNVAVVGHAHPAVTQSVALQMRELNTHSRYLHQNVVMLAERLLATFPTELDTALFATSGTEANELAWRLATEVTGGDGAIIVRHAYHGSSKWFADLSSNEWPASHRPRAVATFEAPHAQPGLELTAREGRRRVVAAAEELASRGHRCALVLVDPAFTSEGILDHPAGFLAGILDGAHDVGALLLADEVQSGYGRSGPQLWRHRLSDITPDIVTMGKPMGAGYPVGGVVTRRDIADQLARHYEYFSTFAATPAAAAAALSVLDILEERRLPEQAVGTGEHLRGLLRALATESDRLGAVRGTGLIAGVDLVAPDGQNPRAHAQAVAEGLAARGVLAGLTGSEGTVLKIRPPLVWQERHSSLLVETLADVLDDKG